MTGVVNEGFSFGLGRGVFPPVFFLGLCGLLFWLILTKRVRGAGWWLILTGGMVNGLSRFLAGFVYDYWKVPGVNLWFNFPDLLITIGVIWLVLT